MASHLAIVVAVGALAMAFSGRVCGQDARTRPKPPAINDRDWIQIPLDAFILHRLEAAGFKPAVPASREELLRRATPALTGREATAAEIEAFAATRDKRAYEKAVDQLLEEPGFQARFEKARSLLKSKLTKPELERRVTAACWERLFGRELAADHPDAFRWLAWELADPTLVNCCDLDRIPQAMDIKHLVKAIAISAIYRQSAAASDEMMRRDPENRLLGRGPAANRPSNTSR